MEGDAADLVLRAGAGFTYDSEAPEALAQLIERMALLPEAALETMEHLAIVKRWYYRGTRVGEIFFSDTKGELPMRRLVRGVSRVFRGEKPENLFTTEEHKVPQSNATE